jgi:ABC-type Fe3+/spermidine/putrescine transport system ATPase subunit
LFLSVGAPPPEAGVVTVKMDDALAGRILAGRAAADASLEDGARVQLAIRPEDIVVAADESPRPDDHTLPGVIEALLFVGDRYEARVSLGGEQRFLLLLPRAPEWREGQAVLLSFAPEVASVWPA